MSLGHCVVGASLGIDDGAPVGFMLGASVSPTLVGAIVARARVVGAFVGPGIVGARVGDAVGDAVGGKLGSSTLQQASAQNIVCSVARTCVLVAATCVQQSPAAAALLQTVAL